MEEKSALEKVLDFMLATDEKAVSEYVEALREDHPDISALDLAWKIVGRKSLKCGLVGAVTGVGGLTTLPITIPADVLLTLRIQAAMVMAVAKVFGQVLTKDELKADIVIIMGANSAKEALKQMGIEVGKRLTRQMVQKYVTREVMKKIWIVVGWKVLTKAGEKSLTSFMKLVPLIGAPIGFAFDYVTARAVGKLAINYYQ